MRPRDVAIAVLAKQPRPGMSKTRLSPPFTPEEAAALAGAMLADALDCVASTPSARRVMVLEGAPGPWLPIGFELIRQRGDSHAERIGNAFADIGGPAILIGMDTPQVSPALLEQATQRLTAPGIDAVLGPATDGGWWLAGLRSPDPRAFGGVPMSLPDTVVHQRQSFEKLGLRWAELEEMTDVDNAESARRVASECPGSRFDRLLARLDSPAVAE